MKEESIKEIRDKIKADKLSPNDFETVMLLDDIQARAYMYETFHQLLGYDPEELSKYDQIAKEIQALNAAGKNTEIGDENCYAGSQPDILCQIRSKLKLQPGKVFYDLGSGVGIPSFFMHLATGCIAKGIEVQKGLCDLANQTARDLNLSHSVNFIQGNVKDINFDDGDVFYLFDPFRGITLKETAEKLVGLSKKRNIKIVLVSGKEQIDYFKEVMCLELEYSNIFKVHVFKSNA